MSALHNFENGVVGRLYNGLQGLVAARKIDLIDGWDGSSPRTPVEADGTQYRGSNVVLATGS